MSNPLTQPFPRSSQRPPIVPVAVTVRTPSSRLERQGDIQPRAFPSLKRSTAASCSEQVKRAAGGSSRTRAARPATPVVEPLLCSRVLITMPLGVELPSPCPAARPPPLPARRQGSQAGGGVGSCEGPGCARQWRWGQGEVSFRGPQGRGGRAARGGGGERTEHAGEGRVGSRAESGYALSPPLALRRGRAGRARAGERRLRWAGELWAPINGCHSSV